MNEDLWRLDAGAVADGIRNRVFSAREVMAACLARLEAVNPALNAITEVRAEAALEAADAADRAVAAGRDLGPLHGVPVTIKGNIDVEGWATVHGCKALKDNIAPAHSPCVRHWLEAGAIIVGRTNTPEFSCRWETANDVFGHTRNPWDHRRTPGGSSGGAAASLATGITPLAHGNDLGGSLRQPAQACGVASIRPSLGRVPSWLSTDQVEPGPGVQIMSVEGPMARRVADVRLGLQAMCARDRHDPWWVPAPLEAPRRDGVRVALVVNPCGTGVDAQVAGGVERAGRLLEAAGYAVEAIEPPGIAEAADVWRVICIGELLTGLEPAVRAICGAGLKQALANYRTVLPDVSIAQYMDAFGRRRRLLREWLAFFERHGVVIGPVGTEPPLPPDGDIASPAATARTIDSFRLTVAVNALGLPSAVVPVGVAGGLPQVVQLIGPPFEELRCLAAAEAIERQVEPLTPIDPR
jgi:amidase